MDEHKHEWEFAGLNTADGNWNNTIVGWYYVCECGKIKYVKKQEDKNG